MSAFSTWWRIAAISPASGALRVLHRGEQLLAPLPQVGHLHGEPFEALAALGLGERAGLEGREVALDCVLGLGDPGVDEGQLLVMVGVLGASPVPGGRDGLVEESVRP